MHKENAALWKVKPLLIKLCGDHIWVDSGLLVTPDDADLFDDNYVGSLAAAREAGGQPGGLLENGQALTELEGKSDANGDATMPDASDEARVDDNTKNLQDGASGKGKEALATTTQQNGDRALIPMSVEPDDDDDDNADRGHPTPSTDAAGTDVGGDFIHPLFLAPRSAHPEPNLGLPEAEAEDVRRLLQLWVQKQEEVSRGTKKLHEGLLRADRLRKTVLRWAKAEAHSGTNKDMSDGEDWYDQEEWGLEEDLKKGHDEEEEDQQLPNKKTRNRK